MFLTATAMQKKKKRLEFGCVVFVDEIRQKVQKNWTNKYS